MLQTFLRPLNYIPSLAASAAISGTARWCDVCIRFVVRMPVWAMSLSSLLCSAGKAGRASLHVDAMGNGLKVFWVYACRIAAEMVQIKTFRNWAICKLIGNAMGQNYLVPSVSNYAVAGFAFCRNPQPASFGFLNLWPESLFERFGWARKSTSFNVMEHSR